MKEIADTCLTVLLVSRSQDTLEALDALLRKHPGLKVERKLVVNGHVDPLHAVQTAPQALVLHVGDNWRAELESLAARPGDRRPPLIVIGPAADTRLMRLAMQAGARDLLPLPLVEADLLAALARVERDLRSAAAGGDGSLTVFLNAKGGCGATLLACNVAHIMSAASRRRVALLDLDVQFGSIPLYFDQFPERGVLQALENSESLDATALDGYMIAHPSGLRILGLAADDPLPLRPVSGKALRLVLDLAIAHYDHVIVELPRHIDPVSEVVIGRAQQIVLVLQQSVAVLRDATRLVECLRRDFAVAKDRIVPVVNRYDKDIAITVEGIRNALACGEVLTIPNDFRTAAECIEVGAPLLTHARGAAITKAVMVLETRLGGSAAVEQPGRLARAFSSLLTPRLS